MTDLSCPVWESSQEPPQNLQELENLLIQRARISSPEAERVFLHPTIDDLHDPFLFQDMALAVELIQRTLDAKGLFFVFGDYDCDGLSAAALLIRYLRAIGARVNWRIPHRLEEGYGISETAVTEMVEQKPDLVITVDCGSASKAEIEELMLNGIPVIVTDHHRLPDEAPHPLALINPWREGESYPFRELSGSGVAFKLIQGVNSQLRDPLRLNPYLFLAALGTVADSMLIEGENRSILQLALESFSEAPAGPKLMWQQRSTPRVDPEFFSFYMAPRLNAAGRLGDANLSLDFLLTDEPPEAEKLLKELESVNQRRRDLEESVLLEAEEEAAGQSPDEKDAILIVHNMDWHPGILGIVASRLMERYQLPVLVIGGQNGVYRGSGRSADSFDLLSVLRAAENFCLSLGGHRSAAGFSFSEEHIDDFLATVRESARRARKEGASEARLHAFCPLPDDLIQEETVHLIDRFSPFGRGFERPDFILESLRVNSIRRVGDRSHLRLELQLNDGRRVQGIAFRMGAAAELYRPGDLVSVIAELAIHEWNGRQDLQLAITAIRPAEDERKSAEASLDLLRVWRSGRLSVYPASEVPLEDLAVLCWTLLAEQAEASAVHMGIFCRLFYQRFSCKLTPFSLGILLDVFSEAGLLELKIEKEHFSYRLLGSDSRPNLREQPSWKRYLGKGASV